MIEITHKGGVKVKTDEAFIEFLRTILDSNEIIKEIRGSSGGWHKKYVFTNKRVLIVDNDYSFKQTYYKDINYIKKTERDFYKIEKSHMGLKKQERLESHVVRWYISLKDGRELEIHTDLSDLVKNLKLVDTTEEKTYTGKLRKQLYSRAVTKEYHGYLAI